MRGAVARAALAALIAALGASRSAAAAAEFRTISEAGTIGYDAPSVKANRVFVMSAHYPVEVVVSIENWSKVRDRAGELFWVEKKALSERRTVVVTAARAEVRSAPGEEAPLAFQATQGVALELAEPPAGGWARVHHRDGAIGYVRVRDVWGL